MSNLLLDQFFLIWAYQKAAEFICKAGNLASYHCDSIWYKQNKLPCETLSTAKRIRENLLRQNHSVLFQVTFLRGLPFALTTWEDISCFKGDLRSNLSGKEEINPGALTRLASNFVRHLVSFPLRGEEAWTHFYRVTKPYELGTSYQGLL